MRSYADKSVSLIAFLFTRPSEVALRVIAVVYGRLARLNRESTTSRSVSNIVRVHSTTSLTRRKKKRENSKKERKVTKKIMLANKFHSQILDREKLHSNFVERVLAFLVAQQTDIQILRIVFQKLRPKLHFELMVKHQFQEKRRNDLQKPIEFLGAQTLK